MVSLGIQDGLNAVAESENSRQDAQDTLHYFALKKARDPRVSKVSYEDFVSQKADGKFESLHQVLADPKIQSLFLQ